MNKTSNIQDCLNDLSVLAELSNIDWQKVPEYNARLRMKSSKEYLEGLRYSKPEELLADKLFKPIFETLGLTEFPQASAGGSGWVDFAIKNSGNPVAIELKQLHTKKGKRVQLENILKDMSNDFANGRYNQIITYLRKADGFEFVLLTNMDDVFYFNRDAITEFKPFFIEKFSDFVGSLNETPDVWELVRRKEDASPKLELDERFFKDLEEWHMKLSNFHWKGDSKSISVLLLNKFIFVRTLEDFGLIPFKFMQETYEEKNRKWGPKGAMRMLEEFFREIDKWFYQYYDTELFKFDILIHIEDIRRHSERLKQLLENILGVDPSGLAVGRGVLSYNFRHIDEDIFGKTYETFLASNRKDEGIYYTGKQITNYIAESIVKSLFSEVSSSIISAVSASRFDEADALCNKFASITVLDAACGSGPFLIKTMRHIFNEYRKIDDATRWSIAWSGGKLTEPEDVVKRREDTQKIRDKVGLPSKLDEGMRITISKLILRHIFGVDADMSAIEVAKLNIWKEAVKLSPIDFRYDRLKFEENHILPDLQLNLVVGDSILTVGDSDASRIVSEQLSEQICQLMQLRNDYLDDTSDASLASQAMELKQNLRGKMRSLINTEASVTENPCIYPLEFPWIFFTKDGKRLPSESTGFSGIIGNPPWQNIKPVKKEFASIHSSIFGNVSKFSIGGADFDKIFDEKMKDDEVKSLWDAYAGKIERASKFIRENYDLYGTGDLSLQKIFLERTLQLAKGDIILLLPSNFHTDEGTSQLRDEIFTKHSIKQLISFENRGKKWFPIDSRFKFDIVWISKKADRTKFNSRFYINNWEEVDDLFEYPVELIPKLSPVVKGIFEFRSSKDIPIVSKIRSEFCLFSDLGLHLTSEFHTTNDKDLFNKKRKGIQVMKGENIHQYNQKFSSEILYWIDEDSARERLLHRELARIKKMAGEYGRAHSLGDKEVKEFGKNIVDYSRERFEKKEFKLDYELPRLAYRTIASSTNERTLIATLVPENVFLINSLNYICPIQYSIDDGGIHQTIVAQDTLHYLSAILNSYVLDYYIRMRVSANLNTFYINELPVPSPDETIKHKVTLMARMLLSDPSKKDVRAEIEIMIAKDLYSLSKEDMEHILSTFIFGETDHELMEEIISSWNSRYPDSS